MKNVFITWAIWILVFPSYASLVCTIEKNLAPNEDGQLAIKAVRTSFGDIVDNQIILGTTISTTSGVFDIEQLKLYYFHEQINCPQFHTASCLVNQQSQKLEISGEDFPQSKVEIALDLGEQTIRDILNSLYSEFSNCL